TETLVPNLGQRWIFAVRSESSAEARRCAYLAAGGDAPMPERETIERAHKDAAQGKAASTQAGEFVREEMHHIRQGKHGARSAKQAIAIGLSKARRAGVKLRAPGRGKASSQTRRKAARDVAKGRRP